MKKFLLLSFLVCVGMMYSASVGANNKPPIDLGGTIPPPSGSIRTPMPLLVANQLDGAIEVVFNSNLGNLLVEVTDSADAVVFSATVNAVAGGSMSIDTGSFAGGVYYLLFTNQKGEYLTGKFVID